MHVQAEYGEAAHWVYKERPIGGMAAFSPPPSVPGSEGPSVLSTGASVWGSRSSACLHTKAPPFRGWHRTPPRLFPPGVSAGDPVLRIEEGRLRDGVIVSTSEDGRRMLVAVASGNGYARLAAAAAAAGGSGGGASGGIGGAEGRAADFAALSMHVSSSGWSEPGQGDLFAQLEEYVLCSDGLYHRRDYLGTTLQRVLCVPLRGNLLRQVLQQRSRVSRGASQQSDSSVDFEPAAGAAASTANSAFAMSDTIFDERVLTAAGSQGGSSGDGTAGGPSPSSPAAGVPRQIQKQG